MYVAVVSIALMLVILVYYLMMARYRDLVSAGRNYRRI